jgi:carbonic anhydrase
MKQLKHLFDSNREWADSMTKSDPDYFSRLREIQRPEYVWIGCSDSRVPANQIVGLKPGQLFVQRNVANQVRLDDPNCMSVLEYAIDALGVKHVIVCGHYRCGGVLAALQGNATGKVGEWLAPLTEYKEKKATPLLEGHSEEEQWSLLCELNVVEQLRHVQQSDVVQRAWREGRELFLHGWIYGLGDGLLRDLRVTMDARDIHDPA